MNNTKDSKHPEEWDYQFGQVGTPPSILKATQKRWPWRMEIAKDTIREMIMDEIRLKEKESKTNV